MPSTNKTELVQLNQYLGNEYQKRTDINEDNLKIDNKLKSINTEIINARNGEVSLDTRLDKNDVAVANLITQSSERVKKSNIDINYYVATTGLDTNDGLTSGTAFKTIQYAISLLPQVINHNIVINVASGTYAETVTISGFSGLGYIKLIGGSALGDNYIIQNIIANYNTCHVRIQGFKCNTTIADAFFSTANTFIEAFYIKSDVVATSFNGITVMNSIITTLGCSMSNRLNPLNAGQLSIVASRDWIAGTGNTYGLYANYGSTICKGGVQPQGTTAEVSQNGGVIR